MAAVDQGGQPAVQLALEHEVATLGQQEDPFGLSDLDAESGLGGRFVDRDGAYLLLKAPVWSARDLWYTRERPRPGRGPPLLESLSHPSKRFVRRTTAYCGEEGRWCIIGP